VDYIENDLVEKLTCNTTFSMQPLGTIWCMGYIEVEHEHCTTCVIHNYIKILNFGARELLESIDVALQLTKSASSKHVKLIVNNLCK
jgi:hypothetical protein